MFIFVNSKDTMEQDIAKRILEIIQHYGLNAAQFADRIDIQRSSISHLISGRNKPSLDLVQKTLQEFNEINPLWLLNGKGDMISSIQNQETLDLTKETKKQLPKTDSDLFTNVITNVNKLESEPSPIYASKKEKMPVGLEDLKSKKIKRIVLFFENGEFEEYINP